MLHNYSACLACLWYINASTAALISQHRAPRNVTANMLDHADNCPLQCSAKRATQRPSAVHHRIVMHRSMMHQRTSREVVLVPSTATNTDTMQVVVVKSRRLSRFLTQSCHSCPVPSLCGGSRAHFGRSFSKSPLNNG